MTSTELLMVLFLMVGHALSTPEAEPSPAYVSHHGSGPSHHSAYHPTTPYPPPYGHSTPSYGHPTPSFGPSSPSYDYSPGHGYSTPVYPHTPAGSYSPVYAGVTPGPYQPRHHIHHPEPHYPPPPKSHSPYGSSHESNSCGYEKKEPACSHNTSKSWCLEDLEYPDYELKAAAEYHKVALLSLYADVTDLSTANSVVRPNTIEEETYLCSTHTDYVTPLRAVNTEGKWRVIVNKIKVDYDLLTQTARIEECRDPGSPCPLVPHCYESKCLQKSIYHRFLIYNPCDKHFPFAVETFRLPASCACHLDDYYITH